MLPGLELMGCADLSVPAEVMHHVVRVESSFNPYAIGVVGGRLVRQPRSLPEAVSIARRLERDGYNFSLGLAQVNRHNLASQGLDTFEKAFEVCPNLQAGARILADCHRRAGGDWGRALSCYYSGNFVTGFRDGYVQKVFASWHGAVPSPATPALSLVERRSGSAAVPPALALRRMQDPATDLRPTLPAVQPAARQLASVAGPMAPAPLESFPAPPRPVDPVEPDRSINPVTVQPFGTASVGPSPAGGAPESTAPTAAVIVDAAFVF